MRPVNAKKPHDHIYADHREGQRQFHRGTHNQPHGSAVTGPTGLTEGAPHAELAQQRADERPQQDADWSERNTHQCPQQRTPHRPWRRAETRSTQHAGEKVDHIGQHRERSQHTQGEPSHEGKILDPGSE